MLKSMTNENQEKCSVLFHEVLKKFFFRIFKKSFKLTTKNVTWYNHQIKSSNIFPTHLEYMGGFLLFNVKKSILHT